MKSTRPCGHLDLVGVLIRRATADQHVPSLDGTPLSLDLGLQLNERLSRVLGDVKLLDQRPASVRRACSLEVRCLLSDLATSRPAPTLASLGHSVRFLRSSRITFDSPER